LSATSALRAGSFFASFRIILLFLHRTHRGLPSGLLFEQKTLFEQKKALCVALFFSLWCPLCASCARPAQKNPQKQKQKQKNKKQKQKKMGAQKRNKR